MATSYTRDGETEYEPLYEIPEDADDDHTVWLKTDDGERVGVEYAEFQDGWREMKYDDYLAKHSDTEANAYMKERNENGYAIQ
jgi:hypothetical protein